jgi:hypothetical protein
MFIKLTKMSVLQNSIQQKEPAYFNMALCIKFILHKTRDYTVLNFGGEDVHLVKETPEQIIAMIKKNTGEAKWK